MANTSRKNKDSTPGAKSRRGFLSESGQSLVELALLTPLLLILTLGIVEIGRYAYFAILVGNAARAGAAFAAQNTGDASVSGAPLIATAAQNDGGAGLTVTSQEVCSCESAGAFTSTPTSSNCYFASNASAGTCTSPAHWVIMVQVTASGTFDPLIKYPAAGLFGILKIPSLTFTSTATERVAQ